MHDELTAVDIKKMQEEIEYRTSVLTPKLKEDLSYARSLGDLSENFEYRAAKRELNKNYSRIRYLQSMIETAVIITVKTRDDVVGLFDKVTVELEGMGETLEIVLVTTLRQDALNNYISKESPIGKAIMGHRVGDRVFVQVNEKDGYYAVIKAIKKGTDDESLKISIY